MAKAKTAPPKKSPPKSKPKAVGKAKKPAPPPAKPKEERYDTPEALAKFDAAYFGRSTELYDAMKEAQMEHLKAKDKASDLKKLYEAARIEHEEHTGNGKKWRGQKPAGVQLSLSDIKPESIPAELWRSFPIERWLIYAGTITKGDIEKLKEGKLDQPGKSFPINTVGDLSDFSQPWPNNPDRSYQLTDIKGIGAEAAKRIDEAADRFWTDWDKHGLMMSYAREMGVPLDADSAKPAAGPAGEDTQPGDGGAKGKVARSKTKRKPAAKSKRKGVDPTQPSSDTAGEDPSTVPFKYGGTSEGGQEEGAEQPAAASSA